mmetsp:Transcript_29277/g.64783  ORF Transcript_29277/g.64783 Transcript_29277/m.64783 type:complete len:87 (+) Transcript_29277:150-410(+)
MYVGSNIPDVFADREEWGAAPAELADAVLFRRDGPLWLPFSVLLYVGEGGCADGGLYEDARGESCTEGGLCMKGESGEELRPSPLG